MANNNLGFEYTLNVNEKATRQNLNTFIKNTFGEGKNAKLSVPIKLDISNSIKDIDFKRLQKDIDNNVQNNLKVKAKIEVDIANVRNQIQSQMRNIQKDLKFKVGLEIDPSAINLIAGTVDVMKTLNAEIDKVKNNMKELNKNLTINIGEVHLGKQYDEILETSKEIKEENKETEASLEEQLNIQKRILEEKRNQMKQTEKDIKAEKDRLDLAKERKANNDKLIEQEKQLRKEASNLDEQIKAEKDRQKLYEKQNDSLKKQSDEQKKLADDLKKTNEEIKKLENDKASAQQRVNLAKEEEQRRANNLAIMKKENEALKEKLANLQKIAKATDVATTSDKTNKTSKGTSIKQQANDTIKQVTDVSEKRIEQEQKVTKEVEKQSEAQIKAINKGVEAEDKANKAKAKSEKKATSSTSSTKKSGGSKRRNLYEDVQSAEIAKAIREETVQGVRSLEEEKAEMRRLGDMVANERGLLQQVTECLERNKELTKENADEVQNLLTKLADEKTLIQEAAGNRDYVNYADFKNALKKYQADPSDKNLEKLEWQMEKWGKIGAMYEYRKDVQEAINTLQKQYNIEAQRSLEIEQKQNKINEQRTSRATNMQSKAAENKIGFDAKKLKYRDAGSFVKEEMYGFSADELAKAIEKYDDALQPFMDDSGFHIDYGKTDKYIADVKDKVEKLTVAMNNATDTQKIEAYNAKIEKLNKNITILQKTVNTYEHIDALMKMKEGVTFDLGTENKDNTDINKVLNLKEIVSEFAQYSKGVNLAREQTSKMRQDLSWLAKDFDKLIAEKSMDEEKWQSLADKTEQYKKELGVTEDQIKQFINTKNEEIEQGNEHLAKLKELQKTFKRGTNEYRECSKVIKDYNNALENDLPITDTIKDMKELINILDRGKDSFDNFSDTNTGEKTVKVVKKQKASIEELAKQMENQDIMAEKIYLANKKNEQAMIDINQVIDRQRKTWKDLTGEVEKYYSKLSSEEVNKGLSIIRAEDKSEKNPNYRISNYMTKSLNEENLSLKEKISLLAEYEAKSKVIENLKRKVNQVEKYGLSYLEDEEDEIQRLNQKKQEQINKTINHTKATQNNNKALKEQADVSKNIAKIDVTQQNKNMQELFKSVALGDNNLKNLSELLKLVRNEVEKFSLVLSSGTGLTDESRKSMYALKESFVQAEKALTTMEQKTGNANFTIEKGSQGFNTQKNKLADLYKEIYKVSESTQESNQVEEKANKIAQETINKTEKTTNAIKQETNALDDKTLALKSMALQAGIAEEKLDDLLMRIENVIGSGRKLSKTEMTKLAKDFPTEDLASASERRANLISEGRKGKYNQTDEYKQRKGQLDALVANYTDNAFDLFQKIYEEAKKVDKTVEQTNKKVARTSKPKKQEVSQQNEVTKAVEETVEATQKQDEISTKVQNNHHAQMRQAIQDIYNITDAQERFNKMLELTGLNYDELYKKYMNEMKNSTFEQMGIKNDRIQMDKVYTGGLNLSQKEAILDRATYLSEEPGQLTKSNMNLWKKYYAEADVISQVIASMTKIVNDYNYEAKTAEQLIYQITEKGLNDQLAIETALRKIEEERLGLLESIGKAEERLAEEKATRKVGTSEEIKALEEELKVLQNNPLYQRYNKAMEAEAKESLKLANLEVTPNNLIQSRFKIEGNLDMDMAYEQAINDFRRTTETLKRFNIKPEEVQQFVALYSKIKEVNSKISDIEYSMQDSHEERILENLRKRLVELDASSKELTSILPKQQEQVQVQQQQAEAVLETAQATEKLAQAQEKIKTNILDSDSLNGGNAVNKEHYLPDAAIALMEAQMGTYLKNGKVTASFKDYDYEGYDDPRDKMAKEYIVYHERFEELNDVLKRMVAMAIDEDDILNKNDFQALRKQYDRLVNIMETDIRNIIYGLESQGAEPFLKGDFANIEDMLKANPKQAWALSPDDLAQDDANGNKGLLDENVKQLKEIVQAQKERAEHEATIRQETKQAEAEVRKELESTKINLSDIDSVYTRIYESTMNAIKASEKFKKLSPSSEDFNAIKLLEEDANYAAETGLNEEYWQTLAGVALDSAKILGVAVDEQQALFNKEIETYNKQIDIMAQEATLSAKVNEDKAEQVQQEEKITNNKVEQIQQEEKVAKVVEESTENYKQAYEEVMRLIEASKEYSKLSEESSEKIDFQDLTDRAETIADDDVAQWKEMYQLSLSLGDEMELNINRERQLAKEKQATLEKTKALLSDGRTTEQYWKDEKEAIEKESLAIEESINAKKQETKAIEELSKAQDESANKTDEVVKSKNKVTKASKQAKQALDEENKALIASTNVKDHIEATLAAIDKVNKSATFKKKAKEDSTLQDMFNELKREANINKSSGILGIDYWDGLIDRIKIFATEMVKMKAKTIDSAVNPLIYKDSGTTSTSKPLSMEDFKAQQEEKAKQRQIRQQEKNARKLKDQQEEAKVLEIVLKQLEDTITNNPHTQLLKVYEDITKITDAQERFNKILEATGLNYDEIYQKALKSERTHAQDSGGIDIDEIFTKQLASFNRDNNPYNTLNYMSVANIKGFNDRVDYVAEYRAKEKVLQNFINAIRLATDEEKEFIAQQELEIKTLKAYPSEAKKMLDAQLQENTTAQIKETKEEIKELVSLTKEIDINTLKDNLGRTWQQIAEEEKKALSKVKEDMLFYELNNMEMDGLYSSNNDSSEKRYKATNYMDTTNFTAKNKKEAIDLLSEYYAKTLILHQLKQKETTQEQEQAVIIEQETEDIKEQTNAIQEQAKVEEQKQVIDEKSKAIKQEKVKVENEEAKALQERIAKNEELIKQEEKAMQDAKETATMHEMEVATINYKIKQAKELRDEQEKQLANANENSEKMKEEYRLQDEGIKRITEKIEALEEERQTKLKMADDLKQQIIQEKALGDISDDVLNSMIDNYNKLQKEAEDTKKSIDLITTAIKNQENAKTKANLPSSIPTSKSPKNNNNGNNTTNNNSGGNGGNNVPPRNNNGRNDGGNIPPDLSEYIKLKQRALMLDIENLIYGKELTDNQKLMVNELVEQVVQLGRSVTSMKELSLEVQKVKQNINETKFDVKVTTTEDKDAKKLLEQQRKEKEAMYKSLFDQRIAEIEAEEKYVKEMTSMYAKLFDQAERNAQVEERAKVVLEDKIAKQKELWQLKVKEFSQSNNSNYADPKDIANMKQMAENIGNNVTNMRELNLQLDEMNMAYKELSSNAKNTKAMYNDAEKQVQQAEKEAEALRKQAEAEEKLQQKIKALIATKEEDLRQTHQVIQNSKAYQNSSEDLRYEFDALIDKMRLTGETTEEVNAQYKQFTQQMNGMKINMVTSQLSKHEGILKKVCGAMKQYVTMNFDVMDMFNYLQRGFQNAFEHVKTLDEAYTNISMTMDVTNKQFQTMVDTAMEVGNANGQLETEVLNMMKVYANAGTTVEEINKQMKATVAFQNVSDLDANTVTQSIQTIIQQYKLLEDGSMDAAEATEYLGDVMVAVSYNLAKEESVAMQEVIAGIETAGNMIKTSGGSFEWFASVIGTLSEVMNASGSETANAINIFVA